MSERYEDIAEAHKETFRWIYEKPELDFVKWLQGGEGIFWITGKAGSGKSTLMKFLYEDPRTHANLPTDFPYTLVSGFFFHDRGYNPLLKSQAGLFRAQIKRVWLLADFKAAFQAIAAQKSTRLHLCLLIDGLDEFSGYHQNIIDALAALVPRNPGGSAIRVQLCISSRPLIVFEKAYLRCSHLKVQDLTREDIKLYVTTNFNNNYELKKLVEKDTNASHYIIGEILSKADGVFLWVMLVVRSLIEGLEYGDNMQTLQRRLSALPAGLEPLYRRMIENIDPFYHKEASRLFKIVEHADKALSPLAMFFADEDPQDALREERYLHESEIEERHSILGKRLKARSAGLIEIKVLDKVYEKDDSSDASSSSIAGDSLGRSPTPWKPSQVQYLHLTTKEFLVSAKVPNWVLTQSSNKAVDPNIIIIACCLRQFRATGSLDLYDYNKKVGVEEYLRRIRYREARFKGIIWMIMFHACRAEFTTQTSQLVYLEALDNFIVSLEAQTSLELASREEHYRESKQPHWASNIYPTQYYSPIGRHHDFVAYLIFANLTRAVLEKFETGYRPDLKQGMPLLFDATTPSGWYFVTNDARSATVDPVLVEELLIRNCDPNQAYESWGEKEDLLQTTTDDDLRVMFSHRGTKTPWENALCVALEMCGWPPFPAGGLGEDAQERHQIMLEWLQALKLFLIYGADAKTIFDVQIYHTVGNYYAIHKMSALAIFNQAFQYFTDPLVSWIRAFMISKGAIEFDEELGIREPENDCQYISHVE
ncbi:hypothetical protein B0J14DRAFT_680553, partial [Halenospora varia]